MPHAALVHDNFEGPTGMGLVLERHAHWLLEAGWSLTLVGENVPGDLRDACRVIDVPPPRRLPSLAEHAAWCSRARRALRGVDADLVHVHSPLLAPAADLLTSHFMAQPAHAIGVRELTTGVEGALRRAQGEISRRVDDLAYRRIPDRTYVSFVSEFLRDEYARHYGPPKGGWVLAPPAPPWNPPNPSERSEARRRWGVEFGRISVGYVGGSDPRKGWFRLEQLTVEPDLHLLFAGPGSERISIGGRPGLGRVEIDDFYAACDVVVAPATFDSAPVAVLQAVTRDVPVVTTTSSGWAGALARTEAGIVWKPDAPLAAAVRAARDLPPANRRVFAEEFSAARQRRALLDAYDSVATRT